MFMVAHRAGNDLCRLRDAERCGVTVVEADVRRFHGRLEVRHQKSVGPLPLYWDTWAAAAPWRSHLRLEQLLDAVAPQTRLLLDLKGRDRKLPEQIVETLDGRPAMVCGRVWPLLDALRGRPEVDVVYSVGNPRELRRMLDRYRDGGLYGVSVRSSLLDAGVVGRLQRIAGLVLAWPVTNQEELAALSAWGVDGAISAEWEALRLP